MDKYEKINSTSLGLLLSFQTTIAGILGKNNGPNVTNLSSKMIGQRKWIEETNENFFFCFVTALKKSKIQLDENKIF